MLSLSPTLAKRAAIALETVSRAPLVPIVNRGTPRNLSALPPSIRALPVDLQVAELANMLADARQQLANAQKVADVKCRARNGEFIGVDELLILSR